MINFHVDLDNTLIFSYRHDIGSDKICVETYQNREISFITTRTFDLLKKVSEKVLIVPTTTRTIEQFDRIDLHIGSFAYVLTCNGGVLLVHGQEDAEWYQESLSLISGSRPELDKAFVILENDSCRIFELRFIKELFLFTKSSNPEKSVERLKEVLDLSVVDVFNNGGKVYVVPKNLNKGAGVRRLREKLQAELVIAAGDSAFDISMLEYAEYGIAPEDLPVHSRDHHALTKVDHHAIFSEKVLERVLEIVQEIDNVDKAWE